MNKAILLYMLVMLTADASAEVFRWEDANGIHLTDDASALPETYRAKLATESTEPPGNREQPGSDAAARQNTFAADQSRQAAVLQANLEQHKRTAEVKKQLQINSREFESTLQSLARFIVVWIILGLGLLAVWAGTLVDIARSEFATTAQKAGWMLLVLLLPLLGMLFYLILGTAQKRPAFSSGEHSA